MQVFDSQTYAYTPLWLDAFAVAWIFSLPIAAAFVSAGPYAALAVVAIALLPRLLWRPSAPAVGRAFVVSQAMYWNLVYPLFFGSPLFLLVYAVRLDWRYGAVLTVVYLVVTKLLLRPDLKDGAGWEFFSKHDWGIRALRAYIQLRLHVPDALIAKPASEPVVLAIHPHGFASDFRIATDALLYAALPGRTVLCLSASVLFALPFVRQLCLWTRCIDASKPVAARALKKGHSLLVIPGGEAEQMRTRPGVEDVFLAKRFGFVKLAMQQGAALVPCYAFGVVDLYDATEKQIATNSKGFLWRLSKNYGVAMPRFQGVFGYLPKRVPNDLVFGEPFSPPCKEKGAPTDAEVAAGHAAYIAALRKLFNDNKDRFGFGDRELVVS